MDHRYYCTAPEGDHLIPLPDEHQDIVALKRRINSGEAPAYCPTSAGGCGRTMILAYNEAKCGEGNVRHLRHRVETNQCGLTRDMETHRRIQELMREHFTSQGHRVTLERYNPENRSRADVFISGGSLRDMTVSLEVQLSGMDRPFDLRDARYREGASTVEWLFARNTRERRRTADDVGHALSVHLKGDQVTLGIVHHLTRDSDPVPLSEWWVTPRGLVCDALVEVQHQEALWEEHHRESAREQEADRLRALEQMRADEERLREAARWRQKQQEMDVARRLELLRDLWREGYLLYSTMRFAEFHRLFDVRAKIRNTTVGEMTPYKSKAEMKRALVEKVASDMGWPARRTAPEMRPLVREHATKVLDGDSSASELRLRSMLHPEDVDHVLLMSKYLMEDDPHFRTRSSGSRPTDLAPSREPAGPHPGINPKPCLRCGLAVDALANSSAGGYHYECMPRPSTADPDPTLF